MEFKFTGKPEAGRKVILFTGRASIGLKHTFSIEEIEKVHKSGRFTLKGSDQQYRPNGTATGDHFRKPHVVDLTDGTLAELRRHNKEIDDAYALRAVSDVLEVIARRDRARAAEIYKKLPDWVKELKKD